MSERVLSSVITVALLAALAAWVPLLELLARSARRRPELAAAPVAARVTVQSEDAVSPESSLESLA